VIVWEEVTVDAQTLPTDALKAPLAPKFPQIMEEPLSSLSFLPVCPLEQLLPISLFADAIILLLLLLWHKLPMFNPPELALQHVQTVAPNVLIVTP